MRICFGSRLLYSSQFSSRSEVEPRRAAVQQSTRGPGYAVPVRRTRSLSVVTDQPGPPVPTASTASSRPRLHAAPLRLPPLPSRQQEASTACSALHSAASSGSVAQPSDASCPSAARRAARAARATPPPSAPRSRRRRAWLTAARRAWPPRNRPSSAAESRPPPARLTAHSSKRRTYVPLPDVGQWPTRSALRREPL